MNDGWTLDLSGRTPEQQRLAKLEKCEDRVDLALWKGTVNVGPRLDGFFSFLCRPNDRLLDECLGEGWLSL